MNTTSQTYTKQKSPAEKYTVKEALTNYYIALMFSVFPLFFTNAYFNIRHDKYGLFLALSLITIVAVGALSVYEYFVPENPQDNINVQKRKISRLSVPDIAMLGFLGVSIISTLFSSNIIDSLLGTAGRNNGLLLIAVYAGIYFVITRTLAYKDYIMIFLAVASIPVFLLAVVNCFYIDPLGMFEQLSNEQTIRDFTSTLGNKNLMSSYICIVLPVLTSFSIITDKIGLRVLSLAASGCGFAALMTSDSDSGILGFAAFIIIGLIWFVRDISRLKRYFLSISVMLVSAKLLRLFSYILNDVSKGMDSFQEIFVYSSVGWILLIICAVITAALYLINVKKPDIILPKAVPLALSVLTAFAVLTVIGAMIYFTFVDTKTDLGSFERLIRFNDRWGTHRGYMWIRSFEIIATELKNGEIFKFIFGTGPDTFYYAFSPYFSGLLKYGDSSTNAAHNEYINYLVTVGFAGAAFYIVLAGSVIARAVRYAKQNPIIIVFVSGVICYAVQAVVNIAQPITTPLFFILLAVTEALVQKCRNN